jgi:hypothetical protein
MNSLSPAKNNDALELVRHNNMRELELESQQPASEVCEALRGSIFATRNQSTLGLRPQSDVILLHLSAKRDYLFDALNHLCPSVPELPDRQRPQNRRENCLCATRE